MRIFEPKKVYQDVGQQSGGSEESRNILASYHVSEADYHAKLNFAIIYNQYGV